MIVILCILPICVFTYLEIIEKTHFSTYSSNKIMLLILEVINIIITFCIIKFYDKLNNMTLAKYMHQLVPKVI